MEGYVIKSNNISSSCAIPPDVLVGDIQKIQKCAAEVGNLDHLVHVKALGSKEGNYGIGMGSDGSALCNSILRALGYIPKLVSEVGAKGGLIKKEEGVISELISGPGSTRIFTPKLNKSWSILIVWGNPEFAPQEFHIPDDPVNIGTDKLTPKADLRMFFIFTSSRKGSFSSHFYSPFIFLCKEVNVWFLYKQFYESAQCCNRFCNTHEQLIWELLES